MREIEVRKKRRKKEGIMKWIIGRKNKGKFRVILRNYATLFKNSK